MTQSIIRLLGLNFEHLHLHPGACLLLKARVLLQIMFLETIVFINLVQEKKKLKINLKNHRLSDTDFCFYSMALIELWDRRKNMLRNGTKWKQSSVRESNAHD